MSDNRAVIEKLYEAFATGDIPAWLVRQAI